MLSEIINKLIKNSQENHKGNHSREGAFNCDVETHRFSQKLL